MSKKFRELLKVRFSLSQLSGIVGKNSLWVRGETGGFTYYKSWAVNDERDLHVIGANKMNKLESYEVEAVDRDYKVYVTDWQAAVGQVLPCQREGGNIQDFYAVAVVENINDTPIDNNT